MTRLTSDERNLLRQNLKVFDQFMSDLQDAVSALRANVDSGKITHASLKIHESRIEELLERGLNAGRK